MENFKIFGYTNLPSEEGEVRKVVITDSNSFSNASTFNENFSLGKHDHAELTFEILEDLDDGSKNPYMDLLRPEAVVGLQLSDREEIKAKHPERKGSFYKFKIKERVPKIDNGKIIYTISCSDYARSVYSQQGEGLNLDYTGTLREIAEEILGETRKNNLYKSLNRDISEIAYNQYAAQTKRGITYSLPYINYSWPNMEPFTDTSGRISYVSFIANTDFVDGEKYDLNFDIIGMNVERNNKKEPFQAAFSVYWEAGGQTITQTVAPLYVEGQPLRVVIPFVYDSRAELINLGISQNSQFPWGSGTNYSISLANFKINKSKENFEERTKGTSLSINHLENFVKQFSNYKELRKEYTEQEAIRFASETRMTYSIENSNLYNSLITLAELFDAQVKFDYLNNAFFFVSNKASQYKGHKLHPDINLKSIARPEKSDDFATILHLEGDGDFEGAIPSLPREWRMYLSDCADKWFDSKGDLIAADLIPNGYFGKYGGNSTYKNLTDTVKTYIGNDPNISVEERNNEIDKFAEHMDKIPNFESTVYDFQYFNDIGLLVDVPKLGAREAEPNYSYLMDTIYNDVRRLNIALNVMSYKYYTIFSKYLTQLQEAAFYFNSINVERKFRYRSAEKLYGEDAPDKYTTSWITYMNAIDASLAAEMNYEEELRNLLGLPSIDSSSTNVDMEPGSFVYNSLMLFGFKDLNNNGVKKLLEENSEKQEEQNSKRDELEKRKVEIEEQLLTQSEYVKESLKVELAGVERDLDRIKDFMGLPSEEAVEGYRYPGIYMIEAEYYNKISQALANVVSLPAEILSQEISLHERLFERESPHNLVRKKEETLELLMDRYEPFSLEARYENSDETTPYGLLEQGLTSFTKLSRPQVSYSISSINIGALEDYSYYTHPEVGDIVSLGGGLYFSYDDEITDHLVITGYSETIRNPDSLTLEVEQDDESERLVRRMLIQSNFLSMGEGPRARSSSIAIPRGAMDEGVSLKKMIMDIQATNLSISNMFNSIIKK